MSSREKQTFLTIQKTAENSIDGTDCFTVHVPSSAENESRLGKSLLIADFGPAFYTGSWFLNSPEMDPVCCKYRRKYSPMFSFSLALNL